MTNTLVLAFHPHLHDGSRVNNKLAQTAASIDGVTVRDEYALYPDGHIDVEAEQRACEAADLIVWQSPMFWYSTPPLLKAWEDQVLAYGWAYGGGHALEGKRLMVAISAGADAHTYMPDGPFPFEQLLTPQRATAWRIGMQWVEPLAIGGAMKLSDAELDAVAQTYAQRLQA